MLAGSQAVWESTGATGTVYTSLLGGALTSTCTYNSLGMLANLKTAKGSTVLHNMDFVIDGATGNMTSRTGMIAQTESFTYDNLDRLTSIKHGTATVMSTDYKPNGNINSKTGLGLYSYGTRPHAVTAVENTNKLVSTNDQVITYTAFNKAASISETVGTDNLLLNIIYGPDQQRWKTELKKSNVLQKTIIFAGDYESITEGGVTKQMYYISGGDGLAAVYVKQSGQTDKIYYVHKDHLGNIVKLTDGNGTEVFKSSYDAWGVQTITNNTSAFHRGYTGHEHLKEFGLVNMNGRMYDPVLGRFLSPDPYVQMMDFSQNYNRYTYCLNNPLMFKDPDGEWIHIAIGAVVGGIFNVVTNWDNIDNFGQGLSYFGLGAAGGAIMATGNVVAGGTLMGGGNSILTQGFQNGFNNIDLSQVGMGVIMGGITGYLGGQIANGLQGPLSSLFSSVSSPMLRGGLTYGINGALTGFTLGTGMALAGGEDIGDALQIGGKSAFLGFDAGLGYGMYSGYKYAQTNNLNPITGGKNVLTNDQLVQKEGQMAQDANPRNGAVAGTAKHEYANDLIDRYQSIHGDRGLEIKFNFNNGVGNRGTLDVYSPRTNTIYDWKFGYPNKTIPQFMKTPQMIKYYNNFNSPRIVIFQYK